MAEKKSWYETGYEGAEKEQEKKSLGYPPDRWWMPVGASRGIVYIDDSPFCIREHTWTDSHENWHHATCIANISDDGCPADSHKGCTSAQYTGHYTMIDVDGYVSKDGTENKFRLMLFSPKTKVLNKLKMKKENRGSLLSTLWTISRADKNAPNTGDDLESQREVDLDALYKLVSYKGKSISDLIDKANRPGQEAERTRLYLAHHFQIPTEGPIPEKIPVFNYPELMAPMSYKELKAAIADAQPFKKAASASAKSDDVPF